jgi:hypothetical protein
VVAIITAKAEKGEKGRGKEGGIAQEVQSPTFRLIRFRRAG